MILILDTHPLVWLLEGSRRLSAIARRTMGNERNGLVVPTICLAEAKYLYAKSRIAIDHGEVSSVIEHGDRFRVCPLNSAVVFKMPVSLDIHDAIICDTALLYDDLYDDEVVVVTKDEQIRNSGLVKTVW